jgi:MFS family permease
VRGRAALIFAIATIAMSHAVMVSIMAMTPVHMTSHGASLTIVGFTISLHIAGMYALSPLFGWASDRFGRLWVILAGQAMFAASVLLIGLAPENTTDVTVALILLGLGWSASTVAGSALVSDLVTGEARVRVQGRSDTIMSLAGAAGGAAAGPVLAVLGYSGVAWAAGVIVLLILLGAAIMGRRVVAPQH